MVRKLGTLISALAVIAFAVPAAANAAPEVTVNGSKASVGTSLTGASTNTILKTSFGNLTCGTVELSTELTSNKGTTFAAVGTGTGKTSTCFFKGVTPWPWDDLTVLSFHSGTQGKGTIGLTFEVTTPELTCHFSATAIPFTYPETGDTLTLKGGLAAKPAACGTASIEGTYTLTSPGGSVVLH